MLDPRASTPNVASGVYTQWRWDVSAGLDMVFILNRGPDKLVTFNFEGVADSTPYVFDAWTGNIASLITYNVTETGISTTVDLKANQQPSLLSRILRIDQLMLFQPLETFLGFHLSNGQIVAIDVQPIPSINISNNSLVILSYHPSANASSTANDIGPIDVGILDTLKPWTEIPGLQQISGIGICTSSFNFSRSPSEVAAVISFGPISTRYVFWLITNYFHQLISPIQEQT
ncbi:hypothetical protein BDZ45DRAFT_745689 [Acephala macrosclerotiorum]|nr:hypothetical protein BDZ45DRAFT_745689 [Acephala macrosclerotiorum]